VSRRILIFRDEAWRIGEPHDICGAIFFNVNTGAIEAHLATDAVYAFAYLLEPDGQERLVARRCDHEGMDPSVIISRICNGEDAITAGLLEDERKWKRYDRELDRIAMAQELQRTVKP
jgi:hypothetical protein